MLLFALGCAGCASVPSDAPAAFEPARCEALRAKLDAADARGLPALAEKAGKGGALSPQQRADVDGYNAAMQEYLNGQCHTAGKG